MLLLQLIAEAPTCLLFVFERFQADSTGIQAVLSLPGHPMYRLPLTLSQQPIRLWVQPESLGKGLLRALQKEMQAPWYRAVSIKQTVDVVSDMLSVRI